MKFLYIYLCLLAVLMPGVSFGQFPYTETFKNASSPGTTFGGSPNAAFLTAGQKVKYSGTAGATTDGTTSGYLRLTNNDQNQTGYIFNDTNFPTSRGLKMSFEYFIYGGNNANGITFFLFDGAKPFSIGSFGSSLGYAQNSLNGVTTPGLNGGYLGFGLDTYGVFGRWNEGKQGGYTVTKGQSLSIRGAGTGAALVATNYPFVTGVQTSAWNSATNPNPNFDIGNGGIVRTPVCSDPRYRKVFIELKPKVLATGIGYDITVKITVGGTTPVTYTVVDNYTGFNTVAPANLKYGFAACAGGQTNYQEIRNLSIKPYLTETGAATPFDYSVTCTEDVTTPVVVTTPPSAPASTPASNLTKIKIDPKRWFQLNNTARGLDALFDSVTNVPVNTGPGWVLPSYDAYYPVRDGEEISITDVKFFDWQGIAADSITLSVITEEGQKVAIAYFTGSKYNVWVGPYPNRVTTDANAFKLDVPRAKIKYLVLNVKSILPTEMELWGTYKAPPAATAAVKKEVKLKEMLGVNAFEWDFLGGGTTSPMAINTAKMNAMKSFSGIRHYMDWEKLELTEGNYTFNPVHSGGWGYDVMYERCKAEGIEVLACLKTLPTWMVNTYPDNMKDYENTPLRYGKDFSDPLSYIEQAKAAFQYAGRYGSNPNVDVSLMRVNPAMRWTGDPSNVVKRGLGLIKYIECDNERNKWWKGRKAYQTAYEYAANLSAFYDGHKNTMGPGVGVKNADPNMIVVMGGLASESTEYVRGMVDWCKKNRGYKANGKVNLCWDVINYHEYSNDAASAQGETSTRGAAPELATLAANAASFIQMAHDYADDMEVWVTEAGFDLNQSSKLKAIAIGNRSVMETQADWTLRSSLQYARSGIKRAFFYKTYDVDSLSTTKFASMGLLNKNNTRRPVADYLYQTKKLFGEYVYRESLSSNPFVDRYELNGKSAYVLVVPDEIGRTATYSLDLGTADSAKVYRLQTGAESMAVTNVATVKGRLQMTVTETPVFVVPFADGSSPSNARIADIEVASNDQNDVNAESLKYAVSVFPNPTTDFIDIVSQGGNAQDGNYLSINIYDQSGRLYKRIVTAKTDEKITQRISLVNSPYGMYVIEITNGKHRDVKKIMRTY